jgi:hypothetical protein
MRPLASLCAVVVAAGAGAAAASGATPAPSGPVFFTAPGGDVAIQPRAIYVGPGLGFSDLQWASWGGPTARATGVNWYTDNGGRVHRLRVRLTLLDRGTCLGREQYLRYRVRFVRRNVRGYTRPSGCRR